VIDHASVDVPNIAQARAFYDAILPTIGCHCLAAGEVFATYGRDRIEFLLLLPFDGSAPTGGNGPHIGFVAPDRSAVDAFYSSGLKAG